MEAKNCKYGELIRPNVTEQHYYTPKEAWNWQNFALEKLRIEASNKVLIWKLWRIRRD